MKNTHNHIACGDRKSSIFFFQNHLVQLLFDTPNCIHTFHTAYVNGVDNMSVCLSCVTLFVHLFDTESICFVQFKRTFKQTALFRAASDFIVHRSLHFTVEREYMFAFLLVVGKNHMIPATVLRFSYTLWSFASLCIMFCFGMAFSIVAQVRYGWKANGKNKRKKRHK